MITKLTKLTHIDPNKEVWLDLTKIIAMERNHVPKSIIIRTDADEPEITIILLEGGKHLTAKETPEQIMGLMTSNV